MVVWLAPETLQKYPVSLAPWSSSRGITVSGFSSGRSLSKDPEHDRDHEPKRQDCSKRVKSCLRCHVTTSRHERAWMRSLLSSKRDGGYAAVPRADKRKAFCDAERLAGLNSPDLPASVRSSTRSPGRGSARDWGEPSNNAKNGGFRCFGRRKSLPRRPPRGLRPVPADLQRSAQNGAQNISLASSSILPRNDEIRPAAPASDSLFGRDFGRLTALIFAPATAAGRPGPVATLKALRGACAAGFHRGPRRSAHRASRRD
jgi:hypothetical protein